MDKKIIKGLVDEKLEVIQEQFSIIKEYEGKIPVIELDLLMNSIRDLYELVLSLQFENTGGVILKPAPREEPPKFTPPPAPAIVHDLAENIEAPIRVSPNFISMEPVSKEEPVREPQPEVKYEPVVPEPPQQEEKYEPVFQPSEEKEAVQDQDQLHEKYQKITLDLFSEGGNSTLAERLLDGQEKRIAEKLQEVKVVDLRNTIGINDKFLFINELFEGNMRIYDEAVQKLNASTTVAQADMLLLDLKIVYNWDSDSPTVKKFVELVRRKF